MVSEKQSSDSEVLTMRLVDRVLRPLFPDDYHAEVQVMIQLMSYDDDVMPDAFKFSSISGTCISDIQTLISKQSRSCRWKIHYQPSRASFSIIDMMIETSMDSIAMVVEER
jgi:polyribonucleotide nucleotidyltransferase